MGLPPFKVREAKKINADLGFAALPNDFTAIPILDFMNHDINNDADTDGCNWIEETIAPRLDCPAIWDNFEYMRADTREPVKACMNLTDDQIDNVIFHTYYHYTDAVVALNFEGTEHCKDKYFTDDIWLEMNEIQRVYLTDWFTKGARDLMVSRLLRKPLDIMQTKIDSMLQGTPESPLKLMIYSAHDTQVDNMMVFLKQNKTAIEYVPYASQVIFELTYSEQCLASQSKSEECFRVMVFYNREPLTFPGCDKDESLDLGCRYDLFKTYMSTILFQGDMD